MVQPRARFARDLSYEHMVFDLRGQDANSPEYQQELVRLAENLKQTQPAATDQPKIEDSGL